MIAGMSTIPRIISVDDHVIEPPDLWTSRVPAKYRDAAPHVVLAPPGDVSITGANYTEAPGTEGKPVAWWMYGETRTQLKRLAAAAGYPKDEAGIHGITYDEMRPGCWIPAERIADMDTGHVEKSLCYPNFPRFCGQVFLWAPDKDLALICVKAYNDWIVEEWCGDSGGRLLPICLIPLWDVNLAAAEVRRNAARGVRAVAFSEVPAWLDLPSLHGGYWDPFFTACEETGTVICMHVGSATKTVTSSSDAPFAVPHVEIFANSSVSMLDYMFSGVLADHPRLKLLYAESQLGWLPYVLDRADDVWEVQRGWAFDTARVPEKPSHYFRQSIHSAFFRDRVGVDLLDRIGVDNACFETDYPHPDSTWPDTENEAKEQFGHLDEATIYKLARGNAERLLELS